MQVGPLTAMLGASGVTPPAGPTVIVPTSYIQDGGISASDTHTFAFDFSTAPGVNRVLMVVGAAKTAQNPWTPIAVPTSITLDGDPMYVRDHYYDTSSGGSGCTPYVSFIAALAVPDGESGTLDIDVTLGGSGVRCSSVSIFVIENVFAGWDQLVTHYDEAFNETSDAVTIPLTVSDTDVNDLMFSVCFKAKLATSPFPPPFEADDVNYVLDSNIQALAAGDDSPLPAFDTRAYGWVWTATGITGTQNVAQIGQPFSPGDPYPESWGAMLFRIKNG